MKIKKDDTITCSSLTFKLLQQMTDRARDLRLQAERIDDLNHMLVSYIHSGIITDTEQINAACAWCEHSDLEAYDILEKVLED
jgi:hypothetical protein